ncbi:hypothetical protein [Flagellimonas sp.]|uniref:hypothetical protein n=1 Tax=Flagellimonas sp. TaxID=2058762 RepID=UPI003BAEA15A
MTQTNNLTPEQIVCDRIDQEQRHAGVVILDNKKLDFSATLGIAIKEYQTEVTPADYVSFVDRKPVRIIEVKKRVRRTKSNRC